jgi:sugar lactone lactonase YvrE
VDPRLVVDCQAELGEGPSWDDKDGNLFWVDIFQGQIHRYDPRVPKDDAFYAGKYVSCVVPRRSGGVVITLQHGFYSLDVNGGNASVLAKVEESLPETRFNDGKCDPAGRLWAGTMDIGERAPVGALYVLEARSGVRTALKGITVSNGLGWSPDKATMYFIDSPTRKVFAFDYDVQTAELKNRRTAVDFRDQPGEPDGMAIDEEGKLWVAHWGGWRVTRFNPATGRAMEAVALPVSQVTSCCFGGGQLDRLYITSARNGLCPDVLKKEPLAGGLFEVETGVKGLPTFQFED